MKVHIFKKSKGKPENFGFPVIPRGEEEPSFCPNQNHQLSWWYALRLEGDGTGGPTRALNGLPVAFPSRAAA